MTKYLCWICGKEIFTPEEREERIMMAGVRVVEICRACEKKLGNLIEQLKSSK